MPENRKSSGQVCRAQIFQHFHDAPLRRGFALRALGDFDNDVITFFRAMPVAHRYLDGIPMARILRLDAATRLSGVPDAADALRCIADALDQSRNAPAAFVHADGE